MKIGNKLYEYKLIQAYKSTISTKDIFEKFDISKYHLIKLVDKYKIPRRTIRKYIHDFDFFENINTEEKAYWLGFIYADGYINKNGEIGIEIHPKDIDHLHKFKKDIKATNPIKTYTKNSTFGVQQLSRIVLYSHKTLNDLKKWGISINKTSECHMPNICQELTHHFIRGFFDGDGSIIKRNPLKETRRHNYKISFIGTKEFMDNIITSYPSYHWRIDERHPERNNNNYTISFGGNNQVLRFLDEIYKNANVYMTRKYGRYLDLTKQQNNKLYKHKI